jgi:hypothetical protein
MLGNDHEDPALPSPKGADSTDGEVDAHADTSPLAQVELVEPC